MRIAVFSDVHSNLPALKTVLADIDTAESTPGTSSATSSAMRPGQRGARTPSGGAGSDRHGQLRRRDGIRPGRVRLRIHESGREGARRRGLRLDESPHERREQAWLRSLAPEIRFEADGHRFLLGPRQSERINEYLYEDKPDQTFARIAAGTHADVIVCGHTHRPYDKTVAGTRFINVGSAGKPKDRDPRACWALNRDVARRRAGRVPSGRLRRRGRGTGGRGVRAAAGVRRSAPRGRGYA